TTGIQKPLRNLLCRRHLVALRFASRRGRNRGGRNDVKRNLLAIPSAEFYGVLRGNNHVILECPLIPKGCERLLFQYSVADLEVCWKPPNEAARSALQDGARIGPRHRKNVRGAHSSSSALKRPPVRWQPLLKCMRPSLVSKDSGHDTELVSLMKP